MAEIGVSLLSNIPAMVAWLTGIILAAKMVRLGGGKAEKLLLIGCSLMLVFSFINPLLTELIRWLMSGQGMSNIATAQMAGFIRLPAAILSFSAFICLIWAFWLKFWIKGQETA